MGEDEVTGQGLQGRAECAQTQRLVGLPAMDKVGARVAIPIAGSTGAAPAVPSSASALLRLPMLQMQGHSLLCFYAGQRSS